MSVATDVPGIQLSASVFLALQHSSVEPNTTCEKKTLRQRTTRSWRPGAEGVMSAGLLTCPIGEHQEKRPKRQCPHSWHITLAARRHRTSFEFLERTGDCSSRCTSTHIVIANLKHIITTKASV